MKRYTYQKQQELISRHQLCERFVENGWVPNAPEDLGEDFIVHIYLQGEATGVLFHVQEKSVTNLEQRIKGKKLVYDGIEVKDLFHWSNFNLPVVLIIWDINQREGYWALVSDIISDLDQQRPHWRKNKSKTRVYLPLKNKTDNHGLAQLKQAVGHYLYPQIAKGREPEVEFGLNFPNTEEGQIAKSSFEQFLNKGGQIRVEGKYISEFHLSEWFARWFGELDVEHLKLNLHFPIASKSFLVAVSMSSNNGQTVHIPNIELKIVVPSGFKTATLSNEHQNVPVHFRYTIPDAGEDLFMRANNLFKCDIYTGHNILQFLDAVAKGGILKFTFLELNNASQSFIIPAHPGNQTNPKHISLVKKLSFIQENIKQIIRLPETFSAKDERNIDRLIEIIEQGKTITHSDALGKFEKNESEFILEVYRKNEPIQIVTTFTGSKVDFLGLTIPTGSGTRYTVGKPDLSPKEFEESLSKLSTGKKLSVTFPNAEIIDIFPDWFRNEAARLSQLLTDRFYVEAIYLFGSLVWGDSHSPDTDIDLAISGLPSDNYLEAIKYLENQTKYAVDLVELDKLPAQLHQRILAEGKLLYEREPVMAISG